MHDAFSLAIPHHPTTFCPKKRFSLLKKYLIRRNVPFPTVSPPGFYPASHDARTCAQMLFRSVRNIYLYCGHTVDLVSGEMATRM